MKKIIKRTGLLLAACCLFASVASAQQTINGQLIDKQTSEPIVGAAIVNKATNEGVSTNECGIFSINTNSEKTTLSISYLGYKPQDIVVEDATQPILLTIDSDNVLDDVVVIGYGQSTRSKLTGSITSVSGEVLEQSAIASILEGLQGRVTGMYVAMSSGLPGDETEIQIRGKNSMNINVGGCCSARPLTKTEPLVLIDGVPFSTESLSALGLGSIGEIDPLSALNPSDVERIDILKDADATAIYGSRGSNGVILITTKKGAML